MLDVHPPHANVHTWRDFSIHIATIVVGLLIAVGLEQSVELYHRRTEMVETRKRIREELAVDHRCVGINIDRLKQDAARWQSYSIALHDSKIDAAHVAAMTFDWALILEPTSAWELAKQSTVFSYMPPAENVRYAYFYRNLAENYGTADRYIDDVYAASSIVQRVRATHTLDTGDRERLLTLTDNLNGLALNQVQIYGFFQDAFDRWGDHPE